jgi:YesN/AraC family two-component response regulator
MKTSILIVDDEKCIRDSLSRYLSLEYNIYQASNGKEALKLFRKNHDITVVLTDIKMPEMDGVNLLEKIKTDSSDTIVILISAFFSSDTIKYILKKQANYYLSKPLDLTHLDTILKNALKGQKISDKKSLAKAHKQLHAVKRTRKRITNFLPLY